MAVALVLGSVLVVLTRPAEAATIDTDAWYQLVNRHSGKVLDVSGASTADGGDVIQWTRNTSAATSSGGSSTPAGATTGSKHATPARSHTSRAPRTARTWSSRQTATAPLSSGRWPTPAAAT
ncbi:RICIN domain-containing protein [Nonomuraea sp. K274]|uniref:RICIN domain-containing protein n=1 Tax=Nonomuraea cypriaca TaxID=1187855 RepID=A0A931AEG7_9ACTN|nr:RICIN domain-containing protein [Nonomuraea cypriaca]